MIEHCISAFSKSQEEKAYRVYVTDALKVISENTVDGEHRSTMAKRWIELIDVKTDTPEDTERAKEKADNIISDFKKRLNRKEVKQ